MRTLSSGFKQVTLRKLITLCDGGHTVRVWLSPSRAYPLPHMAFMNRALPIDVQVIDGRLTRTDAPHRFTLLETTEAFERKYCTEGEHVIYYTEYSDFKNFNGFDYPPTPNFEIPARPAFMF